MIYKRKRLSLQKTIRNTINQYINFYEANNFRISPVL